MAIVNVNSISGINSITAQSNTLNFYTAAGNTLSIGASVNGNITGNVTGNLIGNINSSGVSTITTLSATNIVGVSTVGITSAYIGSINDGPISGSRNRIINGDMRIDQRNAGASVSITGGTANYAADRFNLYVNTGTCALQRVSDAPTGFLYSDKVTVSSAGSSSSGASNAVHFEQKIEGHNIDDLAVGTSNAKTITLSFWVKSSVIGTYSLHFGNDTDRYYVTTYTINSANTWEYKTKTITLATSGTWNTTNGRGLEIVWSLLGGSNYQTSSTDQWISAEDYHATGSVQFAENASATWQITGVQLEPGTVATPFEKRSYGQELALCQRYYEKSYDMGTAPADGATGDHRVAIGCVFNGTSFETQYITFSVRKRVSPTVFTFYRPSFISGTGVWAIYENGSGWATRAIGTGATDEMGFKATATVSGSNAQAIMCSGHWSASAEL